MKDRSQWKDEVRATPIHRIAAELGMKTTRKRLTPCPACGEDREKSNPRGPVGIYKGGLSWRCNVCLVHGDGFDLVAFATIQRKAQSGADWAHLERWFSTHGIGDGELTEADAIDTVMHRPPEHEIRAVLRASTPMSRCRRLDVHGWLKRRPGRLDATRIPAWVLPAQSSVYDGLSIGPRADPRRRHPAPWIYPTLARDFPIAIPMFDGHGVLAGLHLRAITERKGKTRNCYGYDAAALTMADPRRGVPILRGNPPPDTTKVMFVEGATDYMAVSQLAASTPGLAVFGIISGSASAFITTRWPPGSRGILATDNDDAGNRYATEITKAVAPWPVHRLRQQA